MPVVFATPDAAAGVKNGLPTFSELLKRCTSAPASKVLKATDPAGGGEAEKEEELLLLANSRLLLLLLLLLAAGVRRNVWSPRSVRYLDVHFRE